MLCSDIPLDQQLRQRITRIVSISGLHDLRPLLKTQMNANLKLTAKKAIAESQALQEPLTHAEVVCCCGADERPEFIRQNALLANIWQGFGVSTQYVEIPNRRHFNILELLTRFSTFKKSIESPA